MLTMWNLAKHGVTITMSRVLLDVNFNDQTTDNHALNSDWKESPTLNIAMSNYDFVELESGNYCLHNSGAGNNYNHRGYSYVGSKFRDIADYEIEFDVKKIGNRSYVFFEAPDCFSLQDYDNNTIWLNLTNTSIIIPTINTYNTWFTYKLHRESNILTIYSNGTLIYTYEDTDNLTVIKKGLTFGAQNYVTSNNTEFYINNLKFTELTVKPYIIASSTFINAGDTVTLALQGDFQSCKWDNDETATSITVAPASTITYTCEVVDIYDNVITLSQTVNVSANSVVGWGTLSENTLFVCNFANGKINVLRGSLISKGCIEDPYYTDITEVDGVSCLACNRKFGSDYPAFFDSANIWYNETKPIQRTFEFTICTPNDDGNGNFWKELPFFESILNTSKNTLATGSVINDGFLFIRGYWSHVSASYSGMAMQIGGNANFISAYNERLPRLAESIIGNGWSDRGWHHVCFELQLEELNANYDVCSVVMYIDGYPIKTWHDTFSTDAIARTGEWFTVCNNRNTDNNPQFYLSECVISKGLKYGGKFDLPNNFYKQYTTIATEITPAIPVRKFSELAIVNANGTDAPIYAIVIESESLATPICFAQSYHGFIARDHNDELREFTPSGIQINLPERTNQSGSALSFGVASINGEVLEIADTIMTGANPCYLTVLEYLPFDTSVEYDSVTAYKPCYSLTLFVTSCQVTPKGATITAGWHDTLNAKFPFKRYTAKQFKGLRYVC